MIVNKESPEIKVFKASQPWSNSKPNGLELPVFLACLPSALSRFYAISEAVNKEVTM